MGKATESGRQDRYLGGPIQQNQRPTAWMLNPEQFPTNSGSLFRGPDNTD